MKASSNYHAKLEMTVTVSLNGEVAFVQIRVLIINNLFYNITAISVTVRYVNVAERLFEVCV